MIAEVNMPLDEHFDGEVHARIAPYRKLASEISWAAAFDKKRLIKTAVAEARTAFAAA